jgi:hypothetical protein
LLEAWARNRPGEQGRHACAKAVGFHALDAEDADVALLEAGDEMGDRALAKIDAGKVEHDGLADKEAGRRCQRRIDLGKPIHDRHDGSEYERDVRAAAEPHLLTGDVRFCASCAVHGVRLAFLIESLRSGRLG